MRNAAASAGWRSIQARPWTRSVRLREIQAAAMRAASRFTSGSSAVRYEGFFPMSSCIRGAAASP